MIAALFVGFACGWLPGAKRLQKANRWLSTVGLFALLSSMGVELGGNESIMASLPEIGWAAAVLAVCAVTGSVLLTLPLLPWLRQMTAGKEGSAAE